MFGPNCMCVCACAGPGRNQEELRRKVDTGVKELWYFVRSEVKKLGSMESSALQKHTDTLLQDLGHQQRSDTHTQACSRTDKHTNTPTDIHTHFLTCCLSCVIIVCVCVVCV